MLSKIVKKLPTILPPSNRIKKRDILSIDPPWQTSYVLSLRSHNSQNFDRDFHPDNLRSWGQFMLFINIFTLSFRWPVVNPNWYHLPILTLGIAWIVQCNLDCPNWEVRIIEVPCKKTIKIPRMNFFRFFFYITKNGFCNLSVAPGQQQVWKLKISAFPTRVPRTLESSDSRSLESRVSTVYIAKPIPRCRSLLCPWTTDRLLQSDHWLLPIRTDKDATWWF